MTVFLPAMATIGANNTESRGVDGVHNVALFFKKLDDIDLLHFCRDRLS